MIRSRVTRKEKREFLEFRVKQLSETAHEALAQVKWLTNILVEANIIEDIDVVAPRYRTVEDYTDNWGLPYDRKQAYKVNSIDPKAKK